MARGRPTKFHPSFVDKALEYALLGMTDEEMARQFGIGSSTFYAWKQNYRHFREAIKAGRDDADAGVAGAMYRRAMGMTVEEIRIDPDGTETKTVKQLPPDNTSMIFWLKNRQINKWRDRREQVVEVKRVEEMDRTELDTYASELDRQLNELDASITAH